MNKIIGSRIATNFIRNAAQSARLINFYSHLRVKDLDNTDFSNNKKANTSPTVNYDHIVDISINDPSFEVSYHSNHGRTYKISIKQEVSMNLETGYCEEISVDTKTVPKNNY